MNTVQVHLQSTYQQPTTSKTKWKILKRRENMSWKLKKNTEQIALKFVLFSTFLFSFVASPFKYYDYFPYIFKGWWLLWFF